MNDVRLFFDLLRGLFLWANLIKLCDRRTWHEGRNGSPVCSAVSTGSLSERSLLVASAHLVACPGLVSKAVACMAYPCRVSPRRENPMRLMPSSNGNALGLWRLRCDFSLTIIFTPVKHPSESTVTCFGVKFKHHHVTICHDMSRYVTMLEVPTEPQSLSRWHSSSVVPSWRKMPRWKVKRLGVISYCARRMMLEWNCSFSIWVHENSSTTMDAHVGNLLWLGTRLTNHKA